MAVIDSKFSNFIDGGDLVVDDIVVGLRNGLNTRFRNTGDVGTFLPLAGGTMAGTINMDSHSIINLPAPSDPGDSTNKAYVDAAISGVNPLTTKGDLFTFTTVNARLAVGAINGQMLQVNSGTATGLAWSTATYPVTGGASGNILISNGTNYISSTSLWPNNVGTNGKFLISNGTSNGYSTSTIPTSAGATANKLLLSDGTNYVLSTPTFPNASATTRKIIVSDGTNWIASTETWAVPSTSGNVLTSNGTNWLSSAPASSATSVIVDDTTTNATMYPIWVTASSGSLPLKVSSTKLSFNPSTGTLTVTGPISTTTGITSSAGANLLVFTSIASAVNNLRVFNNATLNYPGLVAEGSDSAVGINFYTKNADIYLLDVTSTIAPTLRFYNAAASNYTGLKVATAQASTVTFTLPAADGSNGSLMRTNASGVLSFTTATYPSSSGTARKIIVSDGTNNVYSTETWAVPGTSGNVLTSDGTNWISSVPASTSLLTTKGDLFSFSTVDARLAVATGDGKVLQVSSGAATGLAYSTPTYPSASGSAGKILRADGTNNVYSTSTFADTYAINTLLYNASANTVSGLATANNGVLVTSSGGVPSISSTLPQAVVNNVTAPTTQSFLSGSGTYTTPANCKYIRFTGVAGGGGGGGSGSALGSAGGDGGNTTFGSIITLGGGKGGTQGVNGGGGNNTGGTVSYSGTPSANLAVVGGTGKGAIYGPTGTGIQNMPGGAGGDSMLGGGGGGSYAASYAGGANTGGGGSGGFQSTATGVGGGGGSAGGGLQVIITSPAATYTYAVGAGGTAGTAGTNGNAGAAGGSGVIFVEEFYI